MVAHSVPTRKNAAYQLTVEAPALAPEGALRGQVVLHLTHAPLRSLSIPISGFIAGQITVSPPKIALGHVGHGIARRIVTVRGPRPFSILSVSSLTPKLRGSADPRIVAKAHAVELLIPIEGAPGELVVRRVTLKFSTGRQISLPIEAIVAPGQLPKIAQGLSLLRPAPDFSGRDFAGKTVSLSSFRSHRNVLLTFFPHCFTGGCESHLASLRDAQTAFEAENTQIIAVSTDDARSISQFSRQLHLKFPLLCDTSRQVCQRYGAVQTRGDAPSRMSILIDKNGLVRFIETAVNVRTHGTDMIEKIRELGLN